MANNMILLQYVLADLLFVASGVLILIFALTTKVDVKETPTLDNVARDLLLDTCPLNAAIGNAIFIFITFLMTVPAILMPLSRGWLKFSGYLTTISALFTMIIGLVIWFETLKTRRVLSSIWNVLPSTSQSLLQEQFNCCGYQNSTSPPFVTDTTCPTALVAAANIGCVGPFSVFANNFLDIVFTGAFGIVGVDVLFILSTAILLKERKEQIRYRFIDEKSGTGSF